MEKKMDKRIFGVTSLRDGDDRDFWKTKTRLERLEALEQLRRIAFGYDPSAERLQRTLTITQLKTH